MLLFPRLVSCGRCKDGQENQSQLHTRKKYLVTILAFLSNHSFSSYLSSTLTLTKTSGSSLVDHDQPRYHKLRQAISDLDYLWYGRFIVVK